MERRGGMADAAGDVLFYGYGWARRVGDERNRFVRVTFSILEGS